MNKLKRLFCDHRYKTYLWYTTPQDSISIYMINTYKTRICIRCGKSLTRKTSSGSEVFKGLFEYKIKLLESQGYITEGEYLQKTEGIYE